MPIYGANNSFTNFSIGLAPSGPPPAGANEFVDTEPSPNVFVDTEPTPNEYTDTET